MAVHNKKFSVLEIRDFIWLTGAIFTGRIISPISIMMRLPFVLGLYTSLLLNLEGFTTTLQWLCWGIDNNLTRNISHKDPIQIAKVKGFVAGITSLSLAIIFGMNIPLDFTTVLALLLGSFSYGISLVFFIKALEGLGSSRTGLFFGLAPFIGAIGSIIILKEWIGWVILIE